MARVGFVGLGNMGGPMAANLVEAGHEVQGFDLGAEARDAAAGQGVSLVDEVRGVAVGADAVVTMLPAGSHVESVLGGVEGLFTASRPGTLFIDSSTIDVATTRSLHATALAGGQEMLDAPVSGGVSGATAGTLTFMVGGSEKAYTRGRSLLFGMGKTVIHAGDAGNGQAAKLCNNLMLGIQMLSVAEGFCLAERLGLDAETLFEIASRSSGSCWAMTHHCPVPGLVEGSPADNDYAPGFSAAMMLKDLRLARQAAADSQARTPLGEEAKELYERYVEAGNGGVDYSGIIRMIAGGST